MSTAAEPGGFVVITEVCPKATHEASFKTPPKPDPLKNFYKGEPLALGITQILCGIVHLLFGIVIDVGNASLPRWFPHLFFTGAPFWYGLMNIISGSLSVAATKNPRIGLVRGSLIMNIITAVASVIAIIIYIIHIVALDSRSYYHYYYCNDDSEEEAEKCSEFIAVNHVTRGMTSILLSLAILGLCVSISISTFGCKTLCRTSYSEVSVVIYQTSVPQPSQPNLSAVQTAPPDVGATQLSFTEFENAWSGAPIWKQ